MSESYPDADLRGRSFRGRDLTQADFSHADIRGADFTDAILVGANLSQSRSGLQPRWLVGLVIASIAAALLTGAILGFSSAIPAFLLMRLSPDYTELERLLIAFGYMVAVAALLFIVLRWGFGRAVAAFVLLISALTLGLLVVSNERIMVIGLLALPAVGAPIACIVILACSIAIFRCIARLQAVAIIVAVAALAAIPAMREGIHGFRSAAPAPTLSLFITFFVLASVFVGIFLISSTFVGLRSLAEDKRFMLIQRIVTSLLTRGGTKLRHAILTDASFAHASLEHADLRDAVLVRTDWSAASHLDRARAERTYLDQPQIRRLAVTKDGRSQIYDYVNLEGLNLKDARLTDASFIGASLNGAVLANADLSGARLMHAQLYNTDLTGARITGAYIQDWGISTDTKFANVKCDYIYTRQPTAEDPDPWRKPDNRQENFQPDDFADFIAPIVKTLDLYRQQHVDTRVVGRLFKTLDLFRHDNIDPAASALAIMRLAERHPDAELKVVALEGYGKDKLRVQTVVEEKTDRSALSAEYDAIYAQIVASPRTESEVLAQQMLHKDQRIRQLESLVQAATQGRKFYMETSIMFGATIKAVLFAANPLDLQPLHLDIEIREITAKVRGSKYRDVLELIPVLAARPDDLLQALNTHRPQIVHFSGHGTSIGEIVLVDDQGQAKPVAAPALKALFTTLKDDIRLVILNACYSEVQAAAITSVIDCAVGISDAITDTAAITFIGSFYRALGFGRSVQDSFDQGVTALMLEGTAEEHKPRLLVREGANASSIILIAPLVA